MTLAVALFVVSLLLRVTTPNRHVRGRLTVSSVAVVIYGLLAAAVASGRLSAIMQEQLRPLLPLLLTFAVINGVVALAINPWRRDGVPDRFPRIVQDAIVIGVFAFAATLLLQDRIFAATAAGAVVIGLALQGTLGNLFAGLAIQIEKPFRVGHWVQIGGTDGQVSEVTWRATKIRTKAGNFVVVPNSKLADDIIINYSEPTPETRIEVRIGTSYDNPPNDVKRVILTALRDDAAIQEVRAPEVLVEDFADFSIIYRIRVWTTSFDADERIRDRIRTALYYAFRRNGIHIPYPIGVEVQRADLPPPPPDFAAIERAIRGVQVFGPLADADVARLARAASIGGYAAGELVVKQGDAGSSMFVVASGAVVVTLEPGGEVVARVAAGSFFGEMSLLTGEPRNATVRTAVDSHLVEITAESFRHVVLANPSAVEQIGTAVAARRAELEQRRAGAGSVTAVEPPHNLIDRIRRFLSLS